MGVGLRQSSQLRSDPIGNRFEHELRGNPGIRTVGFRRSSGPEGRTGVLDLDFGSWLLEARSAFTAVSNRR